MSRGARRRRRRRTLAVQNPAAYMATRNPVRLPRVLRNRGGRRLTALREQEAVRSLTGGAMQAVGPGTAVGDTWSASNRKAPEMGALLQRVMGSTETGRLAGIKALHPASEVGPQRWPDKAANQTLVLQNTDVYTIRAPKLADGEKTWRMQGWVTNMLDNNFIAVAESTKTSWINPQGNMNAANCTKNVQDDTKTYTFYYSSQWTGDKHPNVDFQTCRITARSATLDLVANATTNQGVIYACNFTPNMMLMPVSGGPNLLKAIREMTFNLWKELSLMKDVPTDYEDLGGGEEAIADLIDKFDRLSFGKAGAPPSGKQAAYRLVMQDWPWNPTQTMQLSPGSYMAKAEQGCYLPLKHASDELPYSNTAAECYLSAVVPHESDTQTTQMNVLGTEGWTMGAIMVDGLAVESSLTVKVITCIELTARSDSQLAKFVEEAPPLDKSAQEHVRAAMGALPDAYPAADNVLGGIVNWISGALEKSGVPLLSQAARLYSSMNRSAGGALGKALDGLF